MRTIECEFIVVNNDEERAKAEEYFNESKPYITYEYPFSIGREDAFLFYCKETKIEDYFDDEENRLYKYNEVKI